MAVLLVKIDTEKNTYTVVHEIKEDVEESVQNAWTVEKVIELVCKYFNIPSLIGSNRGPARMICSVLLKDYFTLSNRQICGLIGYSTKSDSSNAVTYNIRTIRVNKDAKLYPTYKRLKRVIDGE